MSLGENNSNGNQEEVADDSDDMFRISFNHHLVREATAEQYEGDSWP
ncbi:hypothetical protein CCACVL1_21585 [Corchorus capsularis]|uniref:Uncharacterized protein n=1 Tax=Corchorus capsularis TaxID=210143 RepID=A0A1R3H3Z8_COCAP|nr:hypothetical protein CCACVL1_21585 [Corchorus capsularis]